MPWFVDREGATLRVQIACPMDDWSKLFEEIERRRREDGVLEIEMPERLPGASRVDADILVVLRRVLDHTHGVTLRTP
jgi:hypothetical protein